MVRAAFVSLIVMAVAALMAGAASGQAGPTVPFRIVAEGRSSGVREPTQLVVRDQGAWQALWSRHMAGRDGPIPAIDFGREMVVAIFAGEARERRRLDITQLVRQSDHLEVWYRLLAIRPLPNGEAVALDASFTIVRTERSPLPVRFMREKTPQVY